MLRAVLAVIVLAQAGPAAGSSGLPRPKVAFAADSTLLAGAANIPSRVFYSGGKERRELAVGEHPQVIIIRPDKKLVWVLLPVQKMYMEVDFADASSVVAALPPDARLERTALGKESVHGIDAEKFTLRVTQADGAHLEGTMWVAADDIIVKLQASGSGKSGKVDVAMELRNVQRGPQDAALFELPADYVALPTMGGEPDAIEKALQIK